MRLWMCDGHNASNANQSFVWDRYPRSLLSRQGSLLPFSTMISRRVRVPLCALIWGDKTMLMVMDAPVCFLFTTTTQPTAETFPLERAHIVKRYQTVFGLQSAPEGNSRCVEE